MPVDAYSEAAAQHSFNASIERFRLADETGCDWVTVAEHHFSPFSLTPNPMLLAGALSQVVSKAKIAVLGPTVPMFNPVRVAEEFAILDTMSGGRVVAGLMRGTPNEYVTYNINPEESRERFKEALELIRMVWTEPQPFGWQGRHYEFRAVSIWPRPVQKPHPPLYMSGSSPESGELAARSHIGIGFAVTTLPLATKAIAHYRAQAAAAGWTPMPDDIIYRCGLHIADTDEQANNDLTSGPPRAALLASPTRRSKARSRARATMGATSRRSVIASASPAIKDAVEKARSCSARPESVCSQIVHIRETDRRRHSRSVLHLADDGKARHAIELFGNKMLPRLHEME